MSAADRNKILIAGGVALILIAVVVIVLFVLKGRQPAETTTAGGFATGTEGAPAPAAAAPGTGAPPTPGAPAGAGPAAPGAPAPAAPAPGGNVLGVVQLGRGSDVHTRPDPLLTFEPEPKPPAPELVAGLPPVNLQEGGLRPPGVTEVSEVARRRVAGLLFNERAWAILEENGETFIVKPGDVIDGNRITAISRDSLFLVDVEGRRWQVVLRGSGMGGGAAITGRVPGLPERPPAAP